MAKLVRDRIPEIIEKAGKRPVIHTADEKEYWKTLKMKLKEEVEEVLEDGTEEEIREELADLLEVVNAICEFRGFDKEKLESLRLKKAGERGGFRKRIVLDKVE